jgi:23S rRNA (guanine745-N1)-methyltransferase
MISDAGLYDKLREKLSGMISPSAVLDAGCGCGNLTADIFNSINKPVTFAVDLSKDGIDFAAANFCGENLLWIVGNLNNLPISGNKIDVVLNIMSPANYAEFVRVLKPGGILVKVMPDSDYLKELRRFIYKENDKNEYSNKDVLTNLADNMDIMDITALQYAHSVLPEHIPALFDMTPLTSNIGEREAIRDELTKAGAKDFEITLAFKIAVCRSN